MTESNERMGPPEHGPWVRIKGRGFDVSIRVDDEDDAEIVMLAMAMGDRRRYAHNKG